MAAQDHSRRPSWLLSPPRHSVRKPWTWVLLTKKLRHVGLGSCVYHRVGLMSGCCSNRVEFHAFPKMTKRSNNVVSNFEHQNAALPEIASRSLIWLVK
jgi:hypothetical protein